MSPSRWAASYIIAFLACIMTIALYTKEVKDPPIPCKTAAPPTPLEQLGGVIVCGGKEYGDMHHCQNKGKEMARDYALALLWDLKMWVSLRRMCV